MKNGILLYDKPFSYLLIQYQRIGLQNKNDFLPYISGKR